VRYKDSEQIPWRGGDGDGDGDGDDRYHEIDVNQRVGEFGAMIFNLIVEQS
jgi:hypothetical protein